jgi:hypothetical protein
MSSGLSAAFIIALVCSTSALVLDLAKRALGLRDRGVGLDARGVRVANTTALRPVVSTSATPQIIAVYFS